MIYNINGDKINLPTSDGGFSGWEEYHWNLVDPNALLVGTIGTTGAFAEVADTTNKKNRATDFIPVTPNETLYWLYSTMYGYDADKNFVGKVERTSGVGTVPENVYFVRVTQTTTNGTIPTIPVYRRGFGVHDLNYASAYDYSHGFPMFTDNDSKEGFKAHLDIKAWADKKFCFIGDSFTAPGTWTIEMCQNLLAIREENASVSGGAFSDYDGVPMTAYEQAQSLISGGFSADVILITLGTNDEANKRELGEIVKSNSISDFDLTTYTGGMQACLNFLQNNFPNSIIYIGWTPMGGLSSANTSYIDRMKEVALMYGVEYIETRTCGVTKYSDIYADCYEAGVNGGHPTTNGQYKIAEYMTRLMSGKK